MLRHLTIRDFALISEIALDFHEGFTVLVGETGAGKSIIIDALAAALGSKSSTDVVRSGARKAVVEATFIATEYEDVQALLRQHELEWDAQEIVVRREISSSGASRFFVNDVPTTMAVVRVLSGLLMDFHGQHDTHGLLNVSRHIAVLDAAGSYSETLVEMKGAWDSLVAAKHRTEELATLALSSTETRAECEHVIQQVVGISPRPSEDEELRQTLRNVEGREQILQSASLVRTCLVDSDTSAHNSLLQARSALHQLLPYDASLESIIAEVDSAITTCKEAATAVHTLADTGDFNPAELEHLRERLAAVQRLIRTFGSLEEAIQRAEQAEHALEQLRNIDMLLGQARSAEEACHSLALSVAHRLTELRTTVASKLANQCTTTLRAMGMPKAAISIEVSQGALGSTGTDNVGILFSANAGQDLRPLQKVASGGELSRVMVALKASISDSASYGTMVFDEIDTGISGRVARKVGEVITSISKNTQVICITHLAQIASLAAHMVRVEKVENDGMVHVNANVVHDQDALIEVARLLSGDQVTDAAMQGARELMER